MSQKSALDIVGTIIGLLVGAGALWFNWLSNRGTRREQRIMKGELVVGRLLSIEPTPTDYSPTVFVDGSWDLKVEYEVNGQRYVSVVTKRLSDADRAALKPGERPTLRYDPADPRACSISSLHRRIGVGHSFHAPLWLLVTARSQHWLLPRQPGRPLMMIMAFSDPHREEKQPLRPLVEAASLLLSEWVWMNTDAALTSALLVDQSGSGIMHSTGPLNTHDAYTSMLAKDPERGVLMWGAAEQDTKTDGFTLRARVGDGSHERTFSGPLHALGEELVAWLVENQLCARRTPPTWFARPAGHAALLRYGTLLGHTVAPVLAPSGAIPRIESPAHQAAAADAFNALEQLTGYGEQLKLAVLAVACNAYRGGGLSPAQRAAALALVDGLEDPALRRLAPRYLGLLGQREQAEAAKALAQRATVNDEAYRAWLAGLDEP
ncbi:MAG TPA: DUF3592 domain-containing protein [Polyangiaceae bacterium]|nr:DUF3592 domain-containing protein [Polyangiaceae bacterium]